LSYGAGENARVVPGQIGKITSSYWPSVSAVAQYWVVIAVQHQQVLLPPVSVDGELRR